MSLLAFRRSPADSATPPAPDQSPARAALAENFRQYADQLERLEILAAPQRQLAAAEERLASAQAAVAAIGDLESIAIAGWTSNPSGPLPRPMADQRAAAVAELTVTQDEYDGAKKTWEAIAPAWRAEEQKLFEISKARPTLVRVVLIECARELIQARHDAFQRLADAGGALEGVTAALRKAGDDEGAREVTIIIRAGGTLEDHAFHDRTLKHGQVVRDRWVEMHGRLMLAPDASVAPDEPAAPAAPGAAS